MKKEKRSVWNLVFFLSATSCLAFLLVIAFVYYWGEADTLLLKDVLISPDTLKKTSFICYDPIKKSNLPFVFDKIEFVHKEEHFDVAIHDYASFYDWVISERSVPTVTDPMAAQFNTQPSTLTIIVYPDDNAASRNEKILQRIQFASGGELLRVSSLTPELNPPEEWVYFRCAGIYEKAINLFAHQLKK